MIQVNIWRNSCGEIVEFSIEGHANFAARGKDIVCAGVSSIAQTALLGLTRYLNRQDRFNISGGLLAVKLINSPDLQTQSILETMVLGIAEIANEHKKVVQIHEHRR